MAGARFGVKLRVHVASKLMTCLINIGYQSWIVFARLSSEKWVLYYVFAKYLEAAELHVNSSHKMETQT
jgi:hypothetical protein